MKPIKRMLSILLCALLAAGLFPAGVFAAEGESLSVAEGMIVERDGNTVSISPADCAEHDCGHVHSEDPEEEEPLRGETGSKEDPPAPPVGMYYLNANGNYSVVGEYQTVTSGTASMSNGWYAVTGNVTVESRIEISGEVDLILCNGATLTAKKGIHVNGSNILNIWAQSTGGSMGVLYAGTDDGVNRYCDTKCAAIGSNYYEHSGAISIYGGNITAVANDNFEEAAADAESGSGIGGGMLGGAGTVKIYGGAVNATGGCFSPGIGSGKFAAGGTVYICGGTVNAFGGDSAAGIGSGCEGKLVELKIEGGIVNAYGGLYGAGIGGGVGKEANPDYGTKNILITGGEITAVGGDRAAGIGGGLRCAANSVIIDDGVINAKGGDGGGAGIGGGWFGVNGTVTINGGSITAEGGGQLDLDGNGAGAGIGGGKGRGGGTVTINGGTVNATGGFQAAGIGAGDCTYHDNYYTTELNVVINDGHITARGGRYSAGIGGGRAFSGGVYTINGGTVYAYGTDSGAGIGGTSDADGGIIIITGGNVNAYGGGNGAYAGAGAGIGGGTGAAGGNITISGGSVNAIGGFTPSFTPYSAAGIGGGDGGSGGNVTITGGSVRAGFSNTNHSDAQPIGHGKGGAGEGTLELGNDALGQFIRVGFGLTWNELQWASVSQRMAACRNSNYMMVLVESCFPHSYDRTGCCQRCGADNGPVLEYVSWVNAEGAAQNHADCYPLTASVDEWTSGGAYRGWYAATADVTIPERVTVTGSVNLILCDGVTLTIPKGIEVSEGNSLTIWRQEGASGVLFAGTADGTALSCEAGDAAIGGGNACSCGSITICGGNITAVAGEGAQAIGKGAGASSEGILNLLCMRVFDSDTATVPVALANRMNVCRSGWVKLSPCLDHVFENGICTVCDLHTSVEYLDPSNGNMLVCSGYSAFIGQPELTSGWYVLSENVTTIVSVSVSGNVDLILKNGTTWNAEAGIVVEDGASLTIWAQSDGDGMGAMSAAGANHVPGIGTEGAALIVKGGSISAAGGLYAAGIGGGYGESGGSVTVYGGALTAVGGLYASGVGGGCGGAGGAFTVVGGTVTVTGSEDAEAIGRGSGEADPGTVSINGIKAGYINAAGAVDEWVLADLREAVIRNTDGAAVRLSVCEDHMDDDLDGLCNICGWRIGFVYFDPGDGERHYCTNYEIFNGQSNLTSGKWYVVDRSLTFISGFTVNYGVNLLLCDGAELNITNGHIYVDSGTSLTIWADSQDPDVSGRLTIYNDSYGNAVIGSNYLYNPGSVAINGGVITLTQKSSCYGACIGGGGEHNNAGVSGGNVTVRGGFITLTASDSGAGIGGGGSYSKSGGNGGSVTIEGGTINIITGEIGAGIGGGGSYGSSTYPGTGGSISISGGTLNITTKKYATGIGGGSSNSYKGGAAGTISITGGAIGITTTKDSKCIGGGYGARGNGSDDGLTLGCVRVGTVGAEGAEWVGYDERDSICHLVFASIRLELCEDHVYMSGTDNGDGTHIPQCGLCSTTGPAEAHSYPGSGFCICGVFSGTVHYYDPTDEAERFKIHEGCRQITGSTAEVELTEGWYAAAPGETSFAKRVKVTGCVNIILTEGAVLKIPEGITVGVGNSLTIWAQYEDAGELNVTGPDNSAAGIGGDKSAYYGGVSCGTITINGGNINSKGGAYGAGIGAGKAGDCGLITINAGIVTATGGRRGPGIGTGAGASSGAIGGTDGTIVINGGKVTANAGQSSEDDCGAGIGGGAGGSVTGITINGGVVYAYRYNNTNKGFGIGSGTNGGTSEISLGWNSPDVRIYADSYNGTVTLTDYFKLKDTGERATVSNIGGNAIVPPTPPEVYGLRIEQRERTANDGKTDLRFVYRVDFKDSYLTYVGNVVGPDQEGYRIDGIEVGLNIEGSSVVGTVNVRNIWYMEATGAEPYFLFTAVVTGIPDSASERTINTTPTVRFSHNQFSGTVSAPVFSGSVNGLGGSNN